MSETNINMNEKLLKESVDADSPEGKGKKKDKELLVSIMAIVLYGSTSLAQTIFNKKVLSTYEFQASNLLLLLQMMISASVLLIGRSFGFLTFPTPNLPTANKILPLAVCYFITVLLALDSLSDISLAMYSALKRLVAFIILICEYFILCKTSPKSIWCSVGVMVIGAIIAGLTDMTFDLHGYFLVLSSCLFQALYLVLVKKKMPKILGQ